MRRHLPPLHALRAFEAAARHLSFSRAADELCVTQGAISRQVQSLEEWLGAPLFRRLTRRVELTEEGRLLLPVLSRSFDHMAETMARLTARGRDLRIRVAFSFGIRWLMPRLGHFQARHPDVQVRVTVGWTNHTDVDPQEFDAAITFSPAQPGAAAVEVLPERLTVICAPALAAGLRTPADLAGIPLLHGCSEGRDWDLWLAAAGLPTPDALRRGAVFDAMDPALQAAASGLGATVADRVLAAADVAAGRLALPFPGIEATSGSYWFVCPEGTADRPAIAAFRDWLLAEARNRPE
ncbi:transcriptional regulator GcvA [Azospirillum halopraeferens]|uniref:transcriptional regulator GcvA n=1 Tax=Azospirillum halopraeferens TaxID=34010 RepID=UPI00041497FD|nr:transcriptional regulator GcvA [Azospirillum halopraeferens]